MCDDAPKGPGSFCWNELLTKNHAKAKDFYSKVFGWESHDFDGGPVKYTVFKKDGKDIGGMIEIREDWGEIKPTWLSYIEVENCNEIIGKIEENNGRVLMPPKDIPEVGRFAVVLDPENVPFAVIEPIH